MCKTSNDRFLYQPIKEIEGGYPLRGHPGVMHRAELLYLWIFFRAKPNKQGWVNFLCGLYHAGAGIIVIVRYCDIVPR